MSEAKERLAAAWSTIARDVGAAAFGHYSLHSRAAPKLPAWFKVSSHTKCQPAATGNPGEVRVPLDPTRQPGNLRVSPVRLVTDPNTVTIPAPPVERKPAAGGPTDSVLVKIDPQLEVGTYVGFISDGSGPPLTYFVIYLDGL